MDKRFINDDKFKTLSEGVGAFLNKLKKGEQFHGYDVWNFVKENMPSRHATFQDTIMKVFRSKYRVYYRCIDVHKSLYEKL